MSGRARKLEAVVPAEQLVRQEIERDGPMSFCRFVEIALYHPLYGYYNQTAPQRGRSGDYFTAPQVGGLFSRIFADAILEMRAAVGSDQFALVELGAGDGELLEGVLSELSFKAELKGLRVWAVERSAPARERLWRRLSRFPRCQVVASLDQIEWMGGLEGCFFSNEFFDALPFHRLRYDGGAWREIHVDIAGGKLVETLRPLSQLELASATNGVEAVDGQEIEVRPEIAELYSQWTGWLSRGYVVTFDYGYPRAALTHPSRLNGTWLCYEKHQAHSDAFRAVGRQDMTAHVDFTQLAEAGRAAEFEPALFCSQGIFLTHVGKGRIEEGLSSTANQRAFAGAIQQLVHPTAMGEAFSVLVQAKGVLLPSSWSKIPNRLRRLFFV